MNPCDWFSTPDITVKTDTHVRGSCNCCRDNRYESECGCCCFPFFRRRQSVERDIQIQEIYNEVIKHHSERSHDNTQVEEIKKHKVKKIKRRTHSVNPEKQ